jgi:hypothetical protein
MTTLARESAKSQNQRATIPRALVHPITDADLPEVGQFLGTHFPPDTAADEWAAAWQRSVNLSGSDAPNHGFLLRADGRVVGAYPAIYSTRVIDGRREQFCNLAVWCVSPEYRLHSLSMLQAILAQSGYHFTDLTPIERVQKFNLRRGFRYLDTHTALVPNLPWTTVPRRTRVSADPAVIAATVTGQVKTFYQDHAACRWTRHLVLVQGGNWCYVQWRMERRKNLPLFASIRYASDPDTLRRAFRPLARYFLLRHHMPFTLAEVRVAGGRVYPSILLPYQRRRMYKSATLTPDRIDYLYSELTNAP